MKLKYYLRGLGIGIFVTALIMIIASSGKGTMTDEEVIQRATELGMVTSSKTLISQQQEESLAETEQPVEVTQAPTEEPVEETIQPSVEEPTEAPQESSEEIQEPVSTEVPTDEPVVESEEEPADTPQPGETVTLTVYSGEHSATVAKRMEELGLIEDYLDFDDYLCDNGYSRLVNSGIYKIKPGLSYEELAKIITRTN